MPFGPGVRQAVAVVCVFCCSFAFADDPSAGYVVYEGTDGPGVGKKIVLVSGDEEYRSEEALPQLGKILAERHGFQCVVLFAVDPETGEINPNHSSDIPGLKHLADADLMIIFTRFRSLPPEQLKYIVDYVDSGRPIIGMRTATHAFNLPESSPYAYFSWRSTAEGWDGGFGRQVLGETWISHHGHHGKQSTLGILNPNMKDHPILTGIEDGDIWGPTDVYGVRLPLPGDSKPLVFGQILTGMKADDPPLEGDKNDPMMPVAWIKSHKTSDGKMARVFTTTMGASQDLLSEGVRRMLVNAAYWSLEMEDEITPSLNVEIVGDYEPIPFKFGGFKAGVKPADLQ